MKLIDGTQVYHILQNLNNLEISFLWNIPDHRKTFKI